MNVFCCMICALRVKVFFFVENYSGFRHDWAFDVRIQKVHLFVSEESIIYRHIQRRCFKVRAGFAPAVLTSRKTDVIQARPNVDYGLCMIKGKYNEATTTVLFLFSTTCNNNVFFLQHICKHTTSRCINLSQLLNKSALTFL